MSKGKLRYTAYDLLGRFTVESDYGRTALMRAKGCYGLGCMRLALVYTQGSMEILDKIREGWKPAYVESTATHLGLLIKEIEDVNDWIQDEIGQKYARSLALERDCKSALGFVLR